MAHWAELDENNNVLRVVVGSNDEPDEGYQWIIDNLGGRWVKTSFNTINNKHRLGGTPFRGQYASVGATYDEERDIFVYPKPYPSWVWFEEECRWRAPIVNPDPNVYNSWNEEEQKWESL